MRDNSILAEYSQHYNADETALFYHMTNAKTLEFKDVAFHGGKMSKKSLTVMVCAHMSGTEKVKLLVIGKSKQPRCFKGIRQTRKRGWCLRFLQTGSCNLTKMHCQRRKVVLNVNNCPLHPDVKDLKAVKLVFLPPEHNQHL